MNKRIKEFRGLCHEGLDSIFDIVMAAKAFDDFHTKWERKAKMNKKRKEKGQEEGMREKMEAPEFKVG